MPLEARTILEICAHKLISYIGSEKTKVLAVLAHPRGEASLSPCFRYTENLNTHFPRCVFNLSIYPEGCCTSCAWACDGRRCTIGLRAEPVALAYTAIADMELAISNGGFVQDMALPLSSMNVVVEVICQNLSHRGSDTAVASVRQLQNSFNYHIIALLEQNRRLRDGDDEE